MDQAANIYRVADDLVRHLGPGAYAYSREFAEIAKGAGDTENAITWWDIMLAVIEVRGERGAAIKGIAWR